MIFIFYTQCYMAFENENLHFYNNTFIEKEKFDEKVETDMYI